MVLEGKDCDENGHEGGHGRCRQNGIVGFWVVRGHNCALSAPHTLFRSLWWLEVKDFNENRHKGGYGCC